MTFQTESVDKSHNDEGSVHLIPVVGEIALFSDEETISNSLNNQVRNPPLSLISLPSLPSPE